MKKLIPLLFVVCLSYAGFAQQANWSTNGLASADTKIKVLLYPNPLLGNNFKIKSNNPPSKITVINSIGRVVFLRDQVDPSYSSEYQVNLGNPKRGLYLVKVEYPNARPVVKKLLIK